MRLDAAVIQRLVAVFFLGTAIVGFVFLSLHSLEVIEVALPRHGYLEGCVEITVRLILFFGLWRGKGWGGVASIAYIALVSIYLILEAILMPLQVWTSLYLGLMLILNGTVLFLLNRTLSANPGMVLLLARRLAASVFFLGVFFLVAFLFNFLIAAFLLIAIAFGIRFAAQVTKEESKRPGSQRGRSE